MKDFVLVHGNVMRGVRGTWYVMDGPDIISKHDTREAAQQACDAHRKERTAWKKNEDSSATKKLTTRPGL